MKSGNRNGVSFKDFLAEELADPQVRGHYMAARAEWLVARAVARARRRARLTQVELARRLNTDQKAIWRLEAGQQNATVGLLWKIARATDCDLRVELAPRHDDPSYVADRESAPLAKRARRRRAARR